MRGMRPKPKGVKTIFHLVLVMFMCLVGYRELQRQPPLEVHREEVGPSEDITQSKEGGEGEEQYQEAEEEEEAHRVEEGNEEGEYGAEGTQGEPEGEDDAEDRGMCLLTYDDGKGKVQGGYVEVFRENKRRYCELHGYHFISETRDLDPERSAAWNKILYIQVHLLQGCSAVLFMDSDAFITNPNVTLGTTFAGHEDKDFVFSGDPIHPFNTGIFLVRRSARSFMTLTRAWGYTGWQRKHPWEQAALTEIYLKNLHGEKDWMSILPMRASNSFCPEIWRLRRLAIDRRNGEWQPGDFVMHFAALHPPEIARYIESHRSDFSWSQEPLWGEGSEVSSVQ